MRPSLPVLLTRDTRWKSAKHAGSPPEIPPKSVIFPNREAVRNPHCHCSILTSPIEDPSDRTRHGGDDRQFSGLCSSPTLSLTLRQHMRRDGRSASEGIRRLAGEKWQSKSPLTLSIIFWQDVDIMDESMRKMQCADPAYRVDPRWIQRGEVSVDGSRWFRPCWSFYDN
jgi:hypothetical protein